MTGVIKRLDREKRYGFIRNEKTGIEYFFHSTALKNAQFHELTEGQEVEFEDSEGTKGPRAEDVFVEKL